MIVLHCRKPRFLSLPVSPPIYRSKSAKFQLCIMARIVIIFGRTAPGHICFKQKIPGVTNWMGDPPRISSYKKVHTLFFLFFFFFFAYYVVLLLTVY